MAYLVIEPLPAVRLWIVDSLRLSGFDWFGSHFDRIMESNDSLIFFDWIRDRSGNIVGMEILPSSHDSIWLGDFCRTLTGASHGFVDIMFTPTIDARPDGTQGFGDIYFYRAELHKWLVVVNMKSWLNPGDVEALRKMSEPIASL